MKSIINKIQDHIDLSFDEMQLAMNEIMTGNIDDLEIEKFLLALNEKGPSEEEITAAASVMKEKSLKFKIGDGNQIDTCGTGGSGIHTFNCSTASSFVAALEAPQLQSMEIKQFLANQEVQIF